MIQITVKGETLDLPAGFTLDIQESSSIFNDSGSQSIAVELPATVFNRRVFGFPARPDAMHSPLVRGVRCRISSGAYIRTGTINVDSASQDTISINIGFDNAIAYDSWKSKPLSKVDALPCYRIADLHEFSQFIGNLYYEGKPKEDDLAIFPVCVAFETLDKDETETEYPEILNSGGFEPFFYPDDGGRRVVRLIDNEPTEVFVPYGYGCSPFVKVWKILECIFGDLGLKLDRNPFREDIELARLVVLNNTADSVCAGVLDYAELMPDCTVEEFLQALFVRFGMVYRADFDKGTVHMRLLRDIVRMSPTVEMDGFLSDHPDFEFMTPQYVRLSAATSIEGAAPMTERFEDFLKGFGEKTVIVSVDPSLWETGDKKNGYLAEISSRKPPKQEEGEASEPEHVSSAIDQFCEAIPRREKPDMGTTGYSWNPTSGKWFRNSYFKGQRTCEESSSFFAWDPQPEGYEPLDLNSSDEWCPVGAITTVITPDMLFPLKKKEAIPMFLVGSRHFHTYLENEVDDKLGDCPLSFMFALSGFCGKNETVGRLSADVGLDQTASFSDGSSHDLSLYFHFRNGLYARFWRDYDMILRNADRKCSVSGAMKKAKLRNLDILAPMAVGGVPMLIDTADITLEDSPDASFDMTLMPMMRHPEADEEPFSTEVTGFPPETGVLSYDVNDA